MLSSPRVFVLVWSLVTCSAACFNPKLDNCKVTCTQNSDCPEPLQCQSRFCNYPEAVVTCASDAGDATAVGDDGNADSGGGSTADASVDSVESDGDDASPDSGSADGSDDTRNSADGGQHAPDGAPDSIAADGGDAAEVGSDAPDAPVTSPPAVIYMSVDTANCLLMDRVRDQDDGVAPGDTKDCVFDVGITGPFDALILLTVADGHGSSQGNATLAWDTLVAGQPFPQAVSDNFVRGGETSVLGVSADGDRLINRPDGSISSFGEGEHHLKVIVDATRAAAFRTGKYFRLVMVGGDSLHWGPTVQLSWGRPSINSMSISPESLTVNKVGWEDGAAFPDEYGDNDGALNVDVDGPLDALVLIALVRHPGTSMDVKTTGEEYIWDTIVGDTPFPAGLATRSTYERGNNTWVLGVADSSGTLLNPKATLPRIIGRRSLKLYAAETPDHPFAPRANTNSVDSSVLQLVGLIGDQIIWGPRIVLP